MDKAPNYTTAALIMGGINLFWIFFLLWIKFGLPVILVVGYGLDKLISLIGARRV